MKKSAIALAVLGTLAGAASAQSSVTLYGRLDTSIAYTKLNNGDDVTRMSGGSGSNGADPIGGSRWGLRGSEDLGGGLKANFVIESGIDLSTGEGATASAASGTSGSATSPARLFSRLAWVGISSTSLGEIRLGRQQGMTREINTFVGDISAEGELQIVDTQYAGSGRPLYQNFGTRVDNAVTYTTPNFSGFQARVLMAAGEGATARQQGVMATYAAGPLKAGLSYESYDRDPVGSYNEVMTFGASYNFGMATLLASYQDTSDFGGNAGLVLVGGLKQDHNAYNVGVMVPFGAFEFRAQYTEATQKRSTGDLDLEKYGVSVRYALSKRTQLYGVFTQRDGDAATAAGKESDFAFGIGHNF
jgi:predicted porin